MTKKNNNIGIFIGIAIVIAAIILSQTLKQSSDKTTIITNTTIIEILKYAPSTGSCSASVTPTTIYVGEVVTGTVTNGANTRCEVYLGVGDDWVLFGEGTTNNLGFLTMTGNPTAPGIFTFRAICGSCVTNIVTLTVNAMPAGPDNDGDGIPDSIDPDDDNDGWSDTDEIVAGTNPFDPTSHPTTITTCDGYCKVSGFTVGYNAIPPTPTGCLIYPGSVFTMSPIGPCCCYTPSPPTCNTKCVSKGFVSGRGPFESGSSCTGTEVIEYLVGSSGDICCCLPAGGGDGEFPLTEPECNAWRISMGKTSYTLMADSEIACQDFAWNVCNSLGLIVQYYDYKQGCCIWSCIEM